MISVLYFIRKISAQYKISTKNISIKGVNIEECIVLVPVILILAGWCKVLHHSTEYLMIGMFIRPITATMLEILFALSSSSKNLCMIMKTK